MLPDGRELDEYAKTAGPPKSRPDFPDSLEWMNADTLCFSVRENDDVPDKKQVLDYAITGLSNDNLSSNTQQIEVKKTLIAPQVDAPAK